ncbi:MAG: Zinc-dependent sulfurtransferase SufU [Acidimicrobiales bacterium AG-410-I20]|nr:MAG: Zinc-dependent sulfurtransferase SufU [Acidimicrobiales bacterium AG-410-I20]
MSGLEDLYREIILDHYRNPRNQGELETPPAVMAEGFNPLCGDEVTVHIHVEDGVITDMKFGGHGCSISLASASMMTTVTTGKSLSEVKDIIYSFKQMMSIHEGRLEEGSEETDSPMTGLGDLQALQGVVKFPVRIKCATLGWNTLEQCFEELDSQ